MDEIAVAFGLWLANELDKRDWQQADLVRRLDVKPGVVSSWINGKRKPSYESCLEIAAALGVDPQVVLGRAGRQTTSDSQDRPIPLHELISTLQRQAPVAIPVYDQPISAGKGVAALQQYIYLPPDIDIRSDWYGLPVHGHCMEPIVMQNDTVIVSPNAVPEPGDMVVFDLDNEKGLVKWLRKKRNGELWLMPEQGDPIPFDDERIRIVGVVMRLWRNVRRPRKGMWSE